MTGLVDLQIFTDTIDAGDDFPFHWALALVCCLLVTTASNLRGLAATLERDVNDPAHH